MKKIKFLFSTILLLLLCSCNFVKTTSTTLGDGSTTQGGNSSTTLGDGTTTQTGGNTTTQIGGNTTTENTGTIESKSISKNARVGYQIFVDTYANGLTTNDKTNEIYGDINGIIDNLDFLKEYLNVEVLWLTPVHEAASYHGYDVNDFRSIRDSFGGMEAYKELLKEAHERDIFIMLDLVINHTSTAHEWFVKSRNNNATYRNYYRWTSSAVTENRYNYNGSYYYALFWDQMPDLNYDNPAVYNEMVDICKEWLDLGVDGFRVDGAKHVYNYGDWGGKELYEGSSDLGTLNWNANLEFFNKLSTDLKAYDPNCFMTLEVLDYSSDTIAYYLEQGVDSCFDFSMRNNIINGVNGGTGADIAANYSSELANFYGKNSDSLNSLILSNHDINRAMSDLSENHDKAKAAAAIQMLLPGLSWIYNGDELGMSGVSKGATHGDLGYRQPYKWGNAYQTNLLNLMDVTNGYDTHNTNLASAMDQKNDDSSMLNFYKAMTNLKANDDVISYGDYKAVNLNSSVCTFTRTYKGVSYLVAVNTSSTAQTINYNLSTAEVKYNKGCSLSSSSATLQGYGVLVVKTGELEVLDIDTVVIHYKGNTEYNIWEWSTCNGRWVSFTGTDGDYRTASINISGLDLVYFEFLIGKENSDGSFTVDGGDRIYILNDDDNDKVCHIYIEEEVKDGCYEVAIESGWPYTSGDKVAIWAWEDGKDGSWYSATIENGVIKFQLDISITNAIIVIFDGSATVDWSNKKAQTVDLIVDGKNIITSITWK